MEKLMKTIVFLFLLTNLSIAIAQEHAFLTPIGANEAITGNTGIGRDGSIGAVIYNPAGLATIKSTKISASGSAFSQNEINETFNSKTEDTKYFQTTPSQITTVFTNKNFNWSFSVLVPKAQRFDKKDTEESYTQNYFIEDQETLIGPSISYAISNTFKVGLSLFASKRDYKLIGDVLFEESGNFLVASQKQTISATALQPIIGFLYTPNSNFSVGLRLVGQSTKLSGTFEDNLKVNDQTTVGLPNGATTKNSDANYEKPFEAGLGFSAKVSEKVLILADFSTQFKKRYSVAPVDAYGDEFIFSYKKAQRYHIGLEYNSTASKAYTFGLSYNEDPMADSDLNFWAGTIGLRYTEGITESSFGLFFNQAKDENENENYNVKNQAIGLFVSSSINFI
jgi:long-subunit fatty acid transport protein